MPGGASSSSFNRNSPTKICLQLGHSGRKGLHPAWLGEDGTIRLPSDNLADHRPFARFPTMRGSAQPPIEMDGGGGHGQGPR